ncbi:MAG: ABC transporter [Nitrobacter sp.]|uniref:ABC transporter ATP-binding protein n=1 Tax=Nitrobacter sp. TaxID=29420 RepID=UPI00387DF827
MAEAVTIQGLGHAYVPGKWIFRDLSAGIARGSSFALLGPKGRGKTTLLKVMLGVLVPTEGSVAIQGRQAFVPQLFQVSFDYSVLDMVLMGRSRKVGLFSQPTKEDEDASLVAIERMGLANAARRPFHELSGGQRQLAILARALVAEADILVLDEPTSALDLKNQVLILDWIDRLSHEQGLTVIFTTHHPHHALAVADSALLMLGEHDYVTGPAANVLTETNLAKLYGVPLKRVNFDHEGRTVETLTPVLGSARAFGGV